MFKHFAVLFSLLSLTACAAETGKGAESDVPNGGKFDSFAAPTNHGALSFGSTSPLEISKAARFHAYTFHLDGDANVGIELHRGPEAKKPVDTVLYLYKRSEDGGYGRYIARNDDNGDSVLSSLSKTLGAGDYRFLVKGYNEDAVGTVTVTLNCAGDGCAIPTYAGIDCAFGTHYRDIESSPNFAITESASYEVPSDVPPSRVAALVESVHWNYEELATNLEEALDVVDDGGINFDLLKDLDGKEYWSFEYGAGDNSYGAVIDPVTTKVVVENHDGDLYNCKVTEPAGRWAGLKVVSLGGDKTYLPAIKDIQGAKLTGLPEAGDRIPASAFFAVADKLHARIGNDCDGIPTGAGDGTTEPSESSSWGFTQMVAEQEKDGWESVLTQTERDALDAYFSAHEDSVDIYELTLLPEACGGAGSGVAYILHERQSHTLFYLYSVQYSE